MKFCTVIQGQKSKIEFLWDKNLITPFPILPQFLEIGITAYGDFVAVPVKDNCMLFVPTPCFRAQAIRWCHLNFSPAFPCCHGNKFWDKIDYNLAPVKDNCTLFAPIPPLHAAARLYSVAMGQIPCSTERRPISSFHLRILMLFLWCCIC